MTATFAAATTTTVVDSPAWAWQELRGEVIGSAEAEFYDAYQTEIDRAAIETLSSALRQHWTDRGYTEVIELPADDFGAWAEVTGLLGEDDYFAAWDAAIGEVEFSELIDIAGRYREYLAEYDD